MKGKVADVLLANGVTVKGLRFGKGQYAIALTQFWVLIDEKIARQKNELRQSKALLGKNFQPVKASTELNSNKAYVLNLKEFELLLAKADRAGYKVAQDLRDDLVGLSLEQLFADAFNDQFEKEEREDWIEARAKGKRTRRSLTDLIQKYILEHPDLSPNDHAYLYSNCSDAINKYLFGKRAKEIKLAFGDNLETRDRCNYTQLKELDLVEELICREIEEGGLEPLEATKFVLSTQKIRKVPFTL